MHGVRQREEEYGKLFANLLVLTFSAADNDVSGENAMEYTSRAIGSAPVEVRERYGLHVWKSKIASSTRGVKT